MQTLWTVVTSHRRSFELSEVVMADVEERRETGRSLIVIGVICWIFAALVMFFNPASMKRGSFSLVEVAVGLVIVGLVLAVIGFVKSKRAS